VRRPIVSVAVWLTPAYVAVITAVVVAGAATVSIVNVCVVLPLAICTFAGTDAAVLLLESAMSAPPAGAAAVSAIVPVTARPPAVALVPSVTDCKAAVVVVLDVVVLFDDPPQPHTANEKTHAEKAAIA
jgi:hypothetical protein